MNDDRWAHRLNAEGAKHAAAAKAILELAELEGRTMTDEEKVEYKNHFARAAEVKGQLEVDRQNAEFRKQLAELTGTGSEGFPEGAFSGQKDGGGEALAHKGMSLGQLFVRSSVFKTMQKAHQEGSLPESFKTPAVSLPYAFKVAASPLLESDTTELYGTPSVEGPINTLVPGVFTPGLVQLKPTIADLLPVVPITQGNSAVWRVAKSVVRPGSGDQPIAEGEPKFELKYEFDVAQARLEKYAAFTKISEEYLEDDAAVAGFIDADLPLQIRIVEEMHLAAALYASAGTAVPLATGTTLADAILAAMTEIQDAGGDPNGMLITPTNAAELRAEKLLGGTGDYVLGGPGAGLRNPWDLRIVITRGAVDDQPLVGDFAMGAKLFRKGGLRVSSTNSNEDDFINNLVAIRAEMREILGKTYPEFFVKADLSGS